MQPAIRFLGHCRLTDAAGRDVILPTRKCWGLLSYLCQAGSRDTPREELAALLWPRASEAQARASLRQELAVLRKALGQAGLFGLRAGKDSLGYSPPTGAVDTFEMERLLDSPAAEDWRRAVALYQGEFLAGLILRAAPFEEWMWLERQRLRNRVLGAQQKLLQLDLAGEDSDQAIASAERLLALDPTQEQAYRALMRLLRHLGRRADALRMFQRCRDMLRRELDAEPAPETTALALRIRNEPGPEGNPQDGDGPQVAELVVLCLWLNRDSQIGPCTAAELDRAQTRLRGRVASVIQGREAELLPGLGDRVVVVFPAPDGLETAAEAALALVAKPIAPGGGAELWPAAGLALGEAVEQRRADGSVTLAGPVLDRAVRLGLSADGNQVLAGPEIAGNLPGAYDLGPGGALGGRLLRRA